MFGDTDGVPAPAGFISQLDSQALLTFDNLTVPGAYNDMDMLVRNCKPDHLLPRSAAADGLVGVAQEVCNGGQSDAEYRSQFSTFSILTSPLILGNDVRNLSAACAAIVLNREVIAGKRLRCFLGLIAHARLANL